MTGLDRLTAKLRAMPERCRAAGERAALECAEAVRAEAAGLAPVETGRLRNSLSASAQPGGAAVTAECEYASAVELGTRSMAARPFLYPAAQAQVGVFAALAADYARAAMGG